MKVKLNCFFPDIFKIQYQIKQVLDDFVPIVIKLTNGCKDESLIKDSLDDVTKLYAKYGFEVKYEE